MGVVRKGSKELKGVLCSTPAELELSFSSLAFKVFPLCRIPLEVKELAVNIEYISLYTGKICLIYGWV